MIKKIITTILVLAFSLQSTNLYALSISDFYHLRRVASKNASHNGSEVSSAIKGKLTGEKASVLAKAKIEELWHADSHYFENESEIRRAILEGKLEPIDISYYLKMATQKEGDPPKVPYPYVTPGMNELLKEINVDYQIL